MDNSLGNRMKEQYEDRTRHRLPRRTYSIIRVDGKAFHNFTRHCKKPFDIDLMRAIDKTAVRLCEEIQGAKTAYVQSDEISVLMTDFDTINTSAWFDGNIQKITSISAALATGYFGQVYTRKDGALFDARVFTIPDQIEVENYFIWRQQDASRNSVQMVARFLYSHKECTNKNCSELQDMIHDKGINWNNYPSGMKRGRCVIKVERGWEVVEPPIFTQEREFLRKQIPEMPRYASSQEKDND